MWCACLRGTQGPGLSELPDEPRARRPLSTRTPRRLRLIVAANETGTTLAALLENRGGLPASSVASALAAGGVTINGKRAVDPSQALKLRDEVVANLIERGAPAQGPAGLDPSRILHMDDAVIVVNKPPGVPAQGTAVDAQAGLDAALRELLRRQGVAKPFVGLIHRLDLETTGVTLFGRTPAAVSSLTAQFRAGAVRKRYLALVRGHPLWNEQKVDQPIAADESRTGAYCVSPRGRGAITEFRVQKRLGADDVAASLLEALPRTGRTHQIRVHAAFLGHPLLGDRRYGGPAFVTSPTGHRVDITRVALHAAELWCQHPHGHALHVHAPWPEDLAALESALSAGQSEG